MHRKLHFTTADNPVKWRTHRIMELCEHLTNSVLQPMFQREGAKWDQRFMDFFTFDSDCDPLEPTGTIKFTVPRLFAGRSASLEDAVHKEFSRLKIKTGSFGYERDAHGAIRAITIPVLENPTALAAPPDVNMSQTHGYLVLRDLLGYTVANGRYEFSADDLVKRIAAVSEDRIVACTSSPVWSPAGVRMASPISIKAIRRCLDEVRQFGLWALQHKCAKVTAV